MPAYSLMLQLPEVNDNAGWYQAHVFNPWPILKHGAF